jgi:acyl carrier protein
MSNLVLVFDHQLSEGRQAARFLNELRQRLAGNGKELEKPSDQTPSDRKEDVVLPRSTTEEILAGIWGDVLGLERVSLHDSFLELGGHSLLATQLILRIQEAFQVELPMRCLFEAPTVASLAAAIEQQKGRSSEYTSLPSIVPAPERRYEPFSLSDVQQAYWIGRGNSLELGNVACHIYTEIEFADFDRQRCELALERLIERHDMLRAIVLPEGQQQILKQVPRYSLEVLDLRGQDPQSASSQMEAVRDRMSQGARE